MAAAEEPDAVCIGDRVEVKNVTAGGSPISDGATVLGGTLLRGELKYCIHEILAGSYAPKIKFSPPLSYQGQRPVNTTWNDHIFTRESDLQPDTNYLAAVWFQFVPCELPGAPYEMIPKLNRPNGLLTGATFDVSSSTTPGTCTQPTTTTDVSLARCDDSLPFEPTTWLANVRNSDTGYPIDLTKPVPEGSNVRMDYIVCDPNASQAQQKTYWGGVQFVPKSATCTGGACVSVAWQDEATFVLKDPGQYQPSITYQTMPREPGTFAFFPRLFSTPGSTPDANEVLTGPVVELATCKQSDDTCTNGLV
ncbi:MAG: hypothetical protein H0W94_02010 [Actinobacteria bacterium]|nr:hypothetical protein [Actinomycetota bacterium]